MGGRNSSSKEDSKSESCGDESVDIDINHKRHLILQVDAPTTNNRSFWCTGERGSGGGGEWGRSSIHSSTSKPTLTQRFLRPISRYPKTILLTYFLLTYFLLACACLAWPTRNFTPNTDSSFVAPTNSMSGDAADRYTELYGGGGGMDMVVLLKVS
jgi:hypothetical protein